MTTISLLILVPCFQKEFLVQQEGFSFLSPTHFLFSPLPFLQQWLRQPSQAGASCPGSITVQGRNKEQQMHQRQSYHCQVFTLPILIEKGSLKGPREPLRTFFWKVSSTNSRPQNIFSFLGFQLEAALCFSWAAWVLPAQTFKYCVPTEITMAAKCQEAQIMLLCFAISYQIVLMAVTHQGSCFECFKVLPAPLADQCALL